MEMIFGIAFTRKQLLSEDEIVVAKQLLSENYVNEVKVANDFLNKKESWLKFYFNRDYSSPNASVCVCGLSWGDCNLDWTKSDYITFVQSELDRVFEKTCFPQTFFLNIE